MRAYRADIDGLRAIALFSVLFFHAGFLGFSGGFIGVDFFFVISGYLITSHLREEMNRTGRIRLSEFYARRIRRLYPALLIMILGVLILWFALFRKLPEETQFMMQSIRFAVVGMGNVYFQNHTRGYFDGVSDELPFLHLWSLGVEEQFYLIWPMALMIFLMWRKTRASSRLVPVLIAICLASFCLSQLLLRGGQINCAFYSVESRAWELGIGALLTFSEAWLQKFGGRKHFQAVIEGLAILGAALIVFGVGFYSGHHLFPGVGATLPVASAALLIAVGSARQQTAISKLIGTRPMVRIGLLSYGWYLWHWPLLAMAKIWMLGEVPPLWMRCLALVVSGVCAQISLSYIEKPFRQGGFFYRFSAKQFLPAALMFALALSVTAHNWPHIRQDFLHEESSGLEKMIVARSGADDGIGLAENCAGHIDEIRKGLCSTGNPKSLHRLWVIGNSHAMAFFPMAKKYALGRDLRTTLYYDNGVFFLNYDPAYAATLKDQGIQNRLGFSQDVISDLKKERAENPQAQISVLFANRWPSLLSYPRISVTNSGVQVLNTKQTFEGSDDMLGTSLRKTLTALEEIGVSKILITLPYPEFRYDIMKCLAASQSVQCGTPRAVMDQYRAPSIRIIKDVARDFPNVRLIDPVPAVCNESECPISIQANGVQIPVVYDEDHPSVAAAQYLETKFESDFDWLFLKVP